MGAEALKVKLPHIHRDIDFHMIFVMHFRLGREEGQSVVSIDDARSKFKKNPLTCPFPPIVSIEALLGFSLSVVQSS
jgi:hypothetical protein